ncbi:hypothetical protein F9L07_19820 [Pimelobacter simplex]|uniref:Uncharacterized protein n=1 Tax=Nocardioides simplex TaxID=2045 RepID=A0A7J5DVR7_NOCSI|nr:hypothetical protein [Pimelobacter simplex]KAB2809290.1 hypothetical protein F9L07_19820 [Pimelobacter simplex]
MPVSREDAQALTQLVRSVRAQTPGAGPWDEAGIMAALKKVAHVELTEVVGAALRAAADKTFSTPGGIANTDTSCWRPPPPTMHRRQPLRPSERCRDCSKPRHICEQLSKLPGDGHRFVPDLPLADQSTGELIEPPDTTEARAAVRAAIKESSDRWEAR